MSYSTCKDTSRWVKQNQLHKGLKIHLNSQYYQIITASIFRVQGMSCKKTAPKIPKQTKPTLWYHLKCYHTTIFYKTLGDHSYRMKHFSNNKKVLNIINRFCMNTNSSITIPKEQATCWEKVPKNQSLFYS